MTRIVVIGLGYVGLPLAVALARKFETIGFDIDEDRVAELQQFHDRTGEVDANDLSASSLKVSSNRGDCAGCDVYIITVPTPVDERKRPDLGAVLSATKMVAKLIDPARRPTIIYESTVYPGVTEDCGLSIEAHSELERGRDFRLAYSPERINPGDRVHSVDKITKVIAGEDAEVVEQLAEIYGSITTGGVFRAASIKAAEAAKAIENAQRDINIAFINEVTQIFSKIGLSVWDVLDAAKTKWNFLGFEPGLVGGHCIGVDPFYLSYLAEQVGHRPEIILAGRQVNDGMGTWIADALHAHRRTPGSVLVMGLTFKEDVPDLRNSRAFGVVQRLKELGHDVAVADPIASPEEVKRDHQLELTKVGTRTFDLVIGVVAHREYKALAQADLEMLISPGGTLADLKGIWRDRLPGLNIDLWSL